MYYYHYKEIFTDNITKQINLKKKWRSMNMICRNQFDITLTLYLRQIVESLIFNKIKIDISDSLNQHSVLQREEILVKEFLRGS